MKTKPISDDYLRLQAFYYHSFSPSIKLATFDDIQIFICSFHYFMFSITITDKSIFPKFVFIPRLTRKLEVNKVRKFRIYHILWQYDVAALVKIDMKTNLICAREPPIDNWMFDVWVLSPKFSSFTNTCARSTKIIFRSLNFGTSHHRAELLAKFNHKLI